jgi:hypothetical protein
LEDVGPVIDAEPGDDYVYDNKDAIKELALLNQADKQIRDQLKKNQDMSP